MSFVSLNSLLTASASSFDANFSNLGRSAQVYLSYDQQTGWSFVHLNCLQKICRFLFGCYKNTRLNTVVTQLGRENLGNIPAPLINKIRGSWYSVNPQRSFPFAYSSPPTGIQHDAASWLTQFQTSTGWQLRAPLYQQTKQACVSGFVYNGTTLQLDANRIDQMKRGTRFYLNTTPLAPPATPLAPRAVIQVINGDTLDVALAMKARGLNPAGLNMANAYRAGGGVEDGAAAQEECCFRRSNYHQSLYLTQENPHLHAQMNGTYFIPVTGAIYSPDIQVFRSNEATGYAFTPIQSVAMIASAAYDLYSLNLIRTFPTIDPASATYQNGMREKIRTILRLAILHGHDSVVLGAYGCGAFRNNPTTVSGYFREILQAAEFTGRFREVAFAVLDAPNGANINAFHQALHGVVV